MFIILLGENREGGTPSYIPNLVVKPFIAESTWWETVWEDRTLPSFFIYLYKGLFKLVKVILINLNKPFFIQIIIMNSNKDDKTEISMSLINWNYYKNCMILIQYVKIKKKNFHILVLCWCSLF